MAYKKEAPTTSVTRSQKGQTGIISNDNYNTQSAFVNTPVRAQGKTIGYLEGNCFRKRVIGSKHKLRKPPAWCISKEAFCEEVLPNTENILIEDIESGLVYECPTTVFAEHSFEIQRGDFEPQLALGLRFGRVKSNGHHQVNLFEGGDGNAE